MAWHRHAMDNLDLQVLAQARDRFAEGRRVWLVTVIENMGTVSHDSKLDDLVLLEAL